MVHKSSRRKQVESIQLKVIIKVGAIAIGFATNRRPLSVVQLEGATAGLILKSSYTQLDCSIHSLKVEDLNPASIHKEVSGIIKPLISDSIEHHLAVRTCR